MREGQGFAAADDVGKVSVVVGWVGAISPSGRGRSDDEGEVALILTVVNVVSTLAEVWR